MKIMNDLLIDFCFLALAVHIWILSWKSWFIQQGVFRTWPTTAGRKFDAATVYHMQY